jgi:hypothetical protein
MAARCFMSFGLPQRTHRNLTIFAATENGGEEVTTMFQIELLSGGIFTVYAVDSYANLFLIYKDDAWQWIEINRCKLYYAGALAKKEEKDGNNSGD